MSRTTAARRVALLASSSLGLAAIASAASLGVALAPTTAAAQTVPPTIEDGNAVELRSDTTVTTSDFLLTIEEQGALGSRQTVTSAVEPPLTLNFSAGDAAIHNNGYIVVGTERAFGQFNQAEFRITGVSEFRHSGTIVLGGRGRTTGASIPDQVIDGVIVGDIFNNEGRLVVRGTDQQHDDILSIPGANWIGEGGKILFDINTNNTQATCDRDPVTGMLGAADCLLLHGGSTEGTTLIQLRQTLAGDRGRLTDEGILLVDVSGGTSAQGHFVIDPATEGYGAEHGGNLDKGAFQYVLAYNEEVQQHRLYAILSGSSYQMPMLASAAQNLWRLSTGSPMERQTDVRSGIADGLGGGIWLRVAGELAERDQTNVSTAGGQDFVFDNGGEQKNYAVTGGLDLVSAAEGDLAITAGLMAGYLNGELSYAHSPNEQIIDGWTLGAYGGLVAGALFIDAAINAANMNIRNDTPAFGFFPEDSILASRATLVGARVDAGWRLPLGRGLFAEPLASLSYVRGEFDEVDIRPDDASRPGLAVIYDDPTSFRGSLGGRLVMERDIGAVIGRLSLLGRVWNEFEGENVAAIHNVAFPDDPDAVVVDDFSGTFNEFVVGANILRPDGAVSGYLSFGGKFGDDYSAQTGTAGVRVNW